MNRNRVIAGQAGFSFAGFLFGQASRFAFTLLAARVLDAAALGTYALAVAVIQIAEVLAVAGLDSGLLRFVSMNSSEPLRQKAVIGSALKTSFFLSLIVGLLLLFFLGTLLRCCMEAIFCGLHCAVMLRPSPSMLQPCCMDMRCRDSGSFSRKLLQLRS